MKHIKLSVGEAVVRFLDNQYVGFDGKETKFVESVYALFGHGCVLGIGEALAMSQHSLKVYQGKNEQGMAHAAVSYAKQNNRRKIIPCLTSIGPGSANMVAAAATATVNNLPLLLLLGDTYASRRPDPVLQQIERDNDLLITTNDAFRPVTRYFDRIYRPEMLEAALLNAMRTLTGPETAGAVALAMPQDVQGEIYDFPAYLFEKRVTKIYRERAADEALLSAAELIKASKRPLIIIGGGARYSEAGDAISSFTEKFNVPAAETQAGKSVFPSSNGYNLGGIGVTGNSAANAVAGSADLIIGLGTRLTDFTTSSKTLFKKGKVLTINASSFHGEKLNALHLKGDVKENLKALIPLLKDYKSEYTAEISAAKAMWEEEYARLASIDYSPDLAPEVPCALSGTLEAFNKATGARLTQTKALAIIRKLIPGDAIAVSASGSLPGDMQRMWTTDSPYSYNTEYGYSCMGYEIAGALGSKLAAPEKEVYSFVGDGAYLMLHSEMVTAVQEKKKINILLFDNGGFGCINNLQTGKGIASFATEFRYGAESETPFLPIDYAASARAYGFAAFTAKTPEELEYALKESLKTCDPALIDIKVLPKTMTNGYEGGFWQCGLTNAPRNEKQKEELIKQRKKLEAES
jgi:Acetolactate synthase